MFDASLIERVSILPRRVKILGICIADFFVSFFSFVAAFVLADKQIILTAANMPLLIIFTFVSLLAVVTFFLLALYREIFRFAGAQSFRRLVLGITFVAIVFVLLTSHYLGYSPKRAAFLYWVFFIIFATNMRLIAKTLLLQLNKNGKKTERILIYGAGSAGRQFMLMLKSSAEYTPVGFLDDSPELHKLKVDGLPIYAGKDAKKIIEKLKIDTIIIAMPSAPRSVLRDIVFGLNDCGAIVKTLPGLVDLIDGSYSISDVKDIDITELLGREIVAPHADLFSKNVAGKTVLVTGGAGSIGSELCRQILKSNPEKLIVLDVSEFGLYSIERELNHLIELQELETTIIPVLASVLSEKQLDKVFEKFRIDTIYHAAAYKHVPLVEQNIVAGVINNVFGTLNVAQKSIEYDVPNFTLISTDKAVRPTNVMGASKRVAELVLQALSEKKHKTCFSMVRFGNVLGSSGSVVPLFAKQIKSGGPVTVTDEKITRFFMTIPEAAQLVIQAGTMAQGGEVYVLNMGEPVRIYELAKQMVFLSGLTVRNEDNPKGDIEITFTGLRAGEKLYEELLVGGDTIPTDHELIMAARENSLPWVVIQKKLKKLRSLCEQYDIQAIHEILLDLPTEYQHCGKYVDVLMDEANDDC